ncbi:MAG: hypothetical protein U0792_19545 [Gemmataceae bacterium]
MRPRKRDHIATSHAPRFNVCPNHVVADHPDKGENHTAAIHGEFGILPVPCGSPQFSLCFSSHFKPRPFPERVQFAAPGILEPSVEQNSLRRAQPTRFEEAIHDDSDDGNVGAVPCRNQQGTHAAFCLPRANGSPAERCPIQAVRVLQPNRMAKSLGREAITALWVAFECKPQLVMCVSVGGFESSSSTEVASGFRELFCFQREFTGKSVGFSSERSRKVGVR